MIYLHPPSGLIRIVYIPPHVHHVSFTFTNAQTLLGAPVLAPLREIGLYRSNIAHVLASFVNITHAHE